MADKRPAVSIPLLQEQIRASDSLVRELLEHARELRHDGSAHQVHALSLYASTLELFSGCIVLARVSESTGVPVLLRTMYEALVDLDNLLHDASYVEHLEAANLKQLLRLLLAAKRDNSLLEDFVDDTPAESQAMHTRFAELKAADKGPLSIEERCRRARRLDEYESLYGLLCLDSHNNSVSLANRHITDQPNGVPLISFFQKSSPALVAMRLDLGTKIVLDAARMVHGAFRISPEQIEALAERCRSDRMKRYPPKAPDPGASV